MKAIEGKFAPTKILLGCRMVTVLGTAVLPVFDVRRQQWHFLREAFDHLAGEQRRTILREPLVEIARMLEQNLLHVFWGRASSERGTSSR